MTKATRTRRRQRSRTAISERVFSALAASCAVLLVGSALLTSGCANNTVMAATGTSIGVEIAENPATHVPHAKLGYNRAEVAYVPTNRVSDKKTDGTTKITGAEETADVVMELKYAGIFSWGSSGGIYQRLAVGKTAVSQAGAAFMFSRDASGKLEPEAAKGVGEALAQIQSAGSREKLESFEPAMRAYLALVSDSEKKAIFDAAAKPEFEDFPKLTAAAGSLSQERLKKLYEDLSKDEKVRAEIERARAEIEKAKGPQ